MRFLLLFLSFVFVNLSAEAKYHVVWQVPPDGVCERDWTREILSKLDYDEVWENRGYSIFKDKSVIIIDGNGSPDYIPYFEKLLKKGYRFVVIAHSDEYYHAPTYYYPKIPFVFRNYWKAEFAKYPNVKPFALGYVKNFWNNCPNPIIKAAGKRKYVWAFAGDVNKTTRQSMYQNMKNIPGGFIHCTSGFLTQDALSREQYRDILLDSVFAPAPTGNYNPESFRIYEALECGCIPIVESSPFDYYKLLLGPHPFITVRNWDEAPHAIHRLLANPQALEKKRKECHDWWLHYKENMKTEMADIITKILN